MSKRSRVCQRNRNQEETTELAAVMRRIAQLDRDQKADEARIDAVIKKAEIEIAQLVQRHLAPEALWSAVGAIRDKTVLMTRDVRKNMHRRTNAAKEMQEALASDFLSQCTRFAADDIADATLRTQFFKLLQRTLTSALPHHLKEAIQSRNFACAESIRFEFKCRADRHLYSANFEAVQELLRDKDPAEMQIRLSTIANAATKIDRRVTSLLQRAAS
jgi:hypothetical protein